jgi:4-diphosphocytidyl-2-C-methyl-D-erythritol kinase
VITVRAAAKINLHLGVGAPRDDGFHPLSTVYQAVGLCDDLTAGAPGRAGDWELSLTSADWVDPGAVPTDGSNIVHRAAAALARHHDREVSGRVTIDKAIPVAGGLAGGSADAAAALVALDRLWDARTSDDDLLRLAAELGSDVPFALVGGTALGTGRGEVVEPVPDPGTWWWVLVPSREGLSTPEVYRHFDRLRPDAPTAPAAADDVLAAIATGEPLALARALHNDLQEPAIDLRPDLGRLLDRGESEGALRGIVSGSGPTCAFLCGSPDEARAVAGRLLTDQPTVLVVNGAVAGAHVVAGS